MPCDGGGGGAPPSLPPADDDDDAATALSFSRYCGSSPGDAAELCWQPCRDDGDCCAGQTCHANVTSCGYPENVGADHFFCGSDFCNAAYECGMPCQSGHDASCPVGQRCFPNTPCNANLRSYSADVMSSSSSSGGGTSDYGLPTRAMTLYRQYRSETTFDVDGRTTDATTTATTGTNKANTVGGVVGLFFGISILCLIVGNYMLARRRRFA